MTTAQLPPVEHVAPDAPLDPPEPEHLPAGSWATHQLRCTHHDWPVVRQWLERNDFDGRQLVKKDGVWLFADPTGRAWIVVDYQAGATWTEEYEKAHPDEKTPMPAKRGLQLNHEAGRCAKGTEYANDVAIDRHVRPLVVDIPSAMAGWWGAIPAVPA